jgi:hypothetical protein
MQKAQIVGAVDDPKVFVSRGEIKDLLVGRENDERGKPDLGTDWDDLCLRVLYDPRSILGANKSEGTNGNEQAESAVDKRFHN